MYSVCSNLLFWGWESEALWKCLRTFGMDDSCLFAWESKLFNFNKCSCCDYKSENIVLKSISLKALHSNPLSCLKPTWHFVHAIGMFDMTDTLSLWAFCCATWKPGTCNLQGQKGEAGTPGKNGRDGRDGIVGKPVSGPQNPIETSCFVLSKSYTIISVCDFILI